jgi:hypothetical protein
MVDGRWLAGARGISLFLIGVTSHQIFARFVFAWDPKHRIYTLTGPPHVSPSHRSSLDTQLPTASPAAATDCY